jgi:hypothetical protein
LAIANHSWQLATIFACPIPVSARAKRALHQGPPKTVIALFVRYEVEPLPDDPVTCRLPA